MRCFPRHVGVTCDLQISFTMKTNFGELMKSCDLAGERLAVGAMDDFG